MTNLYQDDSLTLHTDLYQLNMMKAYFDDGLHERRSVFEVFFRDMPFDSGFVVFAGLERIISYMKNLRFTESDITYLHDELGFDGPFLDYLRNFKFKGTIRSVREGEFVFKTEPIVQVEASLAEAQLIETALLNIVNFQTLIATKAARIREVVEEESLAEFGTRRAQEMDAAIWGTRAAYIGGCDSTSNVRAGKIFGIPVSGTMAHAMVQAYRDEYEAFKSYATTHKNSIFLVDTYDTLKSGVPNAIRVADELGDKINFIGIRLDSGDMAFLSKKARQMLDEAGYPDAKIFASSDLDEHTILSLKAQKAKIDSWGVGTKLITAYDQPALGAVYKMAAIADENGVLLDSIKLSSNTEKVSTPGKKKVYRIITTDEGLKAEGDYVTLSDESLEGVKKLTMFHPVHTYITKTVENFTARELLIPIFEDGELVYDMPSLEEIKQYKEDNLALLWDEYKRTIRPEQYPVDLSVKCWKNKMRNIEKVRKSVQLHSPVDLDIPF
ncbi:nicotinate phosphoribosyltransferase [Listeria fleischmannii 1991]|uniref:Nicotinate phosphoribosyltransferase n=3 Tax=Listeria fleischmannii TaxID=1069827 RepID=A0A2X3H4N4_9LIST|nr:nicotinate phosphoribosyltransferase [Listeria fleischmannii]EMG28882.1 nicotinate phosphoribosyltransferase [Listeria fleischmannii subsp. fleischmannii LU2006-1]KMT61186.1 nicotinate phosphoribosyltransferase [Listeria fleischmannii 1991]MBC1397325.1 nicotinate phosphoribosyltransferase [Listeria fleischmannii]MBC1419336.1 nicotinate phosphoribosyltransferase [Listeria fleischmannii]MBC1425694.1 nicotinate phosphoribosyltransferase [Listeria fleischmannii]